MSTILFLRLDREMKKDSNQEIKSISKIIPSGKLSKKMAVHATQFKEEEK